MPDTPNSLQFDGRLTNVSVQYTNPELIGDLVLPPTPVVKKIGVFKKYDKNERFTLPPTYVGPKSRPNEVDWNVTEDTYACVDQGLQSFLSQEDIDNADVPIQPQSDTTEFVTNLVRLAREKRVSDAVFASANYGAGNQIDIAGTWATLTTDVVAQIKAGINACFMPPNVMVMGIDTWNEVSRNEKILAAIKGTLSPQDTNESEFAKYFGLAAVVVGGARINIAKKGQGASFSRVWDGTNAGKGGAALLRVKAGAALRDVVWGAQFDWQSRRVLTSVTDRGAFGGQMIRVVESTVIKTIANDVGYLFKDCLVT